MYFMRTVEEIIATAMKSTSNIAREKADKQIKYNKRCKNRDRLNKKK